MSYMDELRERLEAAEKRFGRVNENSREYRERLLGLMSRIEEEMRQRQDMQRQQTDEVERLSGEIERITGENDQLRLQTEEVERLSGEIERITGENDQLRNMLMSLLQAVETGDDDSLGETLNEMDGKVAVLIGEGQGAPTPSADPAAVDADAGNLDAKPVDAFGGDLDAKPVDAYGGDLDAKPGDAFGDGLDAGPVVDETMAPVDDESAADEPDLYAGETAAFDESTSTMDDVSDSGEPEPEPEPETGASDALDDAPAIPATASASDLEDFLGAGSGDADDVYTPPAYAHPAGEWDDFVDEPAAPVDSGVVAGMTADELHFGAESASSTDEPDSGEADIADDVSEMAEKFSPADDPDSGESEFMAEAAEDAPADMAAGEGSHFDESDPSDDTLTADPMADDSTMEDAAAKETAEPDSGSIRDLLDRVKFQMDGEKDGEDTPEDEPLDDDDDDTAAAG